MQLAQARGILARADDDEVVVHQMHRLYAKARVNKGFFGRRSVGHHQIRVAVLTHLQALAGTGRHHLHRITCLLGELGQQPAQQAGLLCAGGGGEANGRLGALGVADGTQQGEAQQQGGREGKGKTLAHGSCDHDVHRIRVMGERAGLSKQGAKLATHCQQCGF